MKSKSETYIFVLKFVVQFFFSFLGKINVFVFCLSNVISLLKSKTFLVRKKNQQLRITVEINCSRQYTNYSSLLAKKKKVSRGFSY